MNQPKISIIVIYQNDESLLKKFLTDIVNQSFKNIEIICVNNASSDSSSNIAEDFAKSDERIKLINFPENTNEEQVKRTALGVASGDYVCYLDVVEQLESDYIGNLYLEQNNTDSFSFINNHLYRRYFLENDEEITSIIKDKMVDIFERSCEKLKNLQNEIRTELDDFYKNNKDYITDRTYEIYCKYNQIIEDMSEKDKLYLEKIAELSESFDKKIEENNKIIERRIRELDEKIYLEFCKKNAEIKRAYEKINTNTDYFEKLIENKLQVKKLIQEDGLFEFENNIKEKYAFLENDILIKFNTLKRIIDIQNDKINSELIRINPNTHNNDSIIDFSNIEKSMKENTDRIYEQINNVSSSVYEELAKIYKETSELQQKKENENKLMYEKIISEVKNELMNNFNSRIEALENAQNR